MLEMLWSQIMCLNARQCYWNALKSNNVSKSPAKPDRIAIPSVYILKATASGGRNLRLARGLLWTCPLSPCPFASWADPAVKVSVWLAIPSQSDMMHSSSGFSFCSGGCRAQGSFLLDCWCRREALHSHCQPPFFFFGGCGQKINCFPGTPVP